MHKLDFDYETRSELDLTVVGTDNYARHPSTEIVLAAYSINNRPVQVWEPHKSPIPADFDKALRDPFVLKFCFNCSFERSITREKLGIFVPYDEWRDVQVMSRYFSIPGGLDDVCEVLKIDQGSAKLKEGKQLIKMFCEPRFPSWISPLFGYTPPVFRDWESNPVEWERFKEYNKHDVLAQQAITTKLMDFYPPESEWKLWFLDQEINERGLQINTQLIKGAIAIVEKEQAILLQQLQDLTHVENPNSPEQLITWARKEGYPFSSIGKGFVKRALEGEGHTSDACRQALILRQQTSKSAVKKLYAFRDNSCYDNRLRNQFEFGGAARTLRWSSHDVQLQNLLRPTKEVENQIDKAIELLSTENYDAIKAEFSSVLDVAASCIRPIIIASADKKLTVADFSSVESRVIGWISGCTRLLNVFKKGLDPYIDFATEMFNKPYDKVTKEERNQSKAPSLGCGFQLGPGEVKTNADGDTEKTGLLGYAANMGIEMTQEDAIRAVKIFREKYPEIPKLWRTLDKAAINAVENRQIIKAGKLMFDGTDSRALRMILPSGRSLHYIEPMVEEGTFTGRDGETYTKKFVSFMGLDQKTRQWVRASSRPGLWTENSVQAIARDLLANGLLQADAHGLDVVLHVHDEIGTESNIDDENSLDRLIECMVELPTWASGLPIGAEGYCHSYYKKG